MSPKDITDALEYNKDALANMFECRKCRVLTHIANRHSEQTGHDLITVCPKCMKVFGWDLSEVDLTAIYPAASRQSQKT